MSGGNWDAMTIAELENELDRRDALRLKGEAYNREETKQIMAIRNSKIAEEQYDQWGLSAEEYAEAKRGADAARTIEKELHENQIRINKFQARKERTPEEDAELKTLEEGLPKLAENLEKLRKETKPLHVHLNHARSKALKAYREAQTVKIHSADLKKNATSTG